MLSASRLWQHTLRWGYRHAPLPVGVKRAIWRQVMLLKGRLNSGIEQSLIIQHNNADVQQRRAAIQQLQLTSAAHSPEISIIIPCFDQLSYTVTCLQSLAQHPPQTSYEVLVVDDASRHDDYGELSGISGLQLIRHSHNLGFIDSCNHAAGIARGKLLYFLNNDTVLLTGSIDALAHTFALYPKTGLVGSQLLYPNGFLQEAGGIVWRDGSAWNYGRMQPRNDPRFNYLRSVDYCSGASIMVPRQLFLELGGFDTHYKPAYYEDTDLALKLRQRSYQVLYQPASKVVHFEGVSHGTDESQGLKQHQRLNRERFLKRWSAQLSSHRPNGQDPDLEKDRGVTRRVLLIDSCTPSPDRDAGSVCLLNLMLLLRHLGYQPSFIPDDNYANLPPYTQQCQALGIECLYAPYVTSVKEHLRRHGQRYDLIVLFRPDLAHIHWPTVRRFSPQARVLYYPHDLHYLRLEREAAVLRRKGLRRQAAAMQKRELNNSRHADATVVLSLSEQQQLRQLLPDQCIEHLPLMLNTSCPPERSPSFGGHNLVFVGNFSHAPNADAVQWFAGEILPRLLQRWPKTRFHVVGANPPPAIAQLASAQIVVHGFVEDLDGLLQTMQVAVVPLRFGAGMKGKVGSALRCGLPVVTTAIGSEGMPAVHGTHLLVADHAVAFAEAVSTLLGSAQQWQHLSEGGLAFAAAEWGPEASLQRLSAILERLGLDVDPAALTTPVALYPFDPPHQSVQPHLRK